MHHLALLSACGSIARRKQLGGYEVIKTTFTTLSGKRYRCNREGCGKIVTKAETEAHRMAHYNADRPPRPVEEPSQRRWGLPEVKVVFAFGTYYWICWKHNCDGHNYVTEVGKDTCKVCGTKVNVVDKNEILPTPKQHRREERSRRAWPSFF